MEVVPALGDSSPFQRRDVAEWTHRDHLTGVLEKARVETDRWAATTANSKHAYGKVVDSRDRSLPDGSAHQRQRQQLEVFQTKGPGGSLQVIRTQTVTSTNSCSPWRGTPSAGPGRSSRPALPAITQDFENLQLTLNPIDLSSEKSKASVGRSGSIGTRRPPSRPRSLVGKPSAAPTTHDTPPSSPVLRICHQTRADQSAKSVKTVDQSTRSARTTRETGSQSPRTTGEIKSGDQSVSTTTNKDGRNVTSSPSSKSSTVTLNGHLSVTRKKSSSIEDLHNGVSEDRDDSDESFKRSSKVRRSLQFPLKKLEARGGVCKLLQELEESSKRTAAEGRIARKSFEALESVLRRNISLTSGSDKEDNDSPGEREEDSIENGSHHAVNSVSIDDFARKFNVSRNKFMLEKRHSYMDTLDKSSQDENEEEKSTVNETKNLFKRHSFVTVESLKEVRGRLKHLNSPLDGLDTESGMEELEDNDDGIGTDDSNKQSGSSVTEVPQLRVKSYVFGLEGVTRPNRLPVLGTGSLESRTSNKASVNGSRSDEWYNRRKSYGFESVHGDESHSRSSALISKFEDKNRLTSTDSGICRSSEQFIFPSWKRKQQEVDTANPSEGEVLQISHSIPLARAIEDRIPTLESNKEDIRKGRTTVVTLGSKAEQSQDPYAKGKELEPLHCNGETERKQGSYLLNKTSNISNSDNNRGSSQSVTVSIPVVQEEPSPSIVSRRLFFQQLSQGTSVSIEKPWSLYSNKGENQMPSLIGSRKIDADDWWRNTQAFGNGNSREEDWKSNKLSNGVLKRHSIAVDNSWKSFNNLNMSVHENLESGSAVVNEPCYRPSQITDNEVKRHSIAVDKFNYLNEDGSRVDSEALVTRKQKRVEFCKTEVHFAAEPGRFNIVETDEKPPPTNMFRRRRRHSTPAPNPDPAKNASNLPVVRFGDSVYEKQLLSGTDDLEERSPDVNGEPMHTPASPIRVREETYVEETFTDVSHSLPAITLDDNDDHCLIESSADPPPRSILKNYKKPKPYLIGENEGSYPDIVEKEEKWGVRLRPICQDQPAAWKPPASLPIRDEVMPTEYSGQSELQKLLRSLRPAQASRGKTSTAAIIPGRREEPRPSDCSVAERVRQVEQQVTAEVKGYSTRVNFGAGEATVVDEYRDMANGHGAYISDDHHKSAWQWREENMVTQDASKLKGTDYAMQIGQNCHVTSVSRSLREPNSLEAEGGLHHPRGGTTTTITIDLSLPPSSSCETHQQPNGGSFHVNGMNRISPHEVLQSPLLIMRTIHNPQLGDRDSSYRTNAFKSSSVTSTNHEQAQRCEPSLDDRLGEMSMKPLGVAVVQDSDNSPKDRDTERCFEARRSAPRERSENGPSRPKDGAQERDSCEEMVAVSQLDAWRALYCDVDSELSDDSERADEEVRSYMSGEGDVAGSEVSGSWSRATGLKNLHRGYSTGNSGLERLEDSQSRPPQQMSVATAILSSYNDSDRLRAVETLVNTRSGQPKITSISLRYGEDGGEPLRFTSKTAISAERTAPAVSSTRLGPPVSENIHPSLKERKTIFDTGHSNAINSFSQRTSIHSSESPTRTLNVSSFEKKSFGHKRENSPLPKSFMSSRIPNDELIITEVAPEKSVTAKQAIHSELPLKSTSLFDKEVNFKTQQFSASKQVTASCQTVAPKSQRASLMSSKMVSSFERKAPTVSVAGSQSPKPSRVTYPSGESNEKVVPTSHRSSPRSRGTTDSLGSTGSSSVRLDTITATSKTSFTNSAQSHAVRSSKTDGSSKTTFGNMQHTEKKDDAIGPTIALHIQEPSESTLQNVLGKTNRLSNCDSSFLSPTGKNSLVVTESRRVTRSTSRSPTPTKKVTPPSKNSKSKDFIGRVGNDSPIYQNSRKSTSPANGLQRQPSPPPIYQNCEEVSDKYECGLDRMESDSVILAELTRAADEILQAVNGYTDEDSRRGSSDDDCRRLRERRSTPLGTIAEAPSLAKRESSSSHRATVNGSAKRTQRVSSRTKLGPTSSTSSVESFTRETRRVATKSSGSNTSSRAARMVQRANSRELLLQTNASSSEDIASGSETKKRVPPPRRSRTSSSSNKEVTSSSTKSREKTKEGGETSRTRERTSSSRTKTRESSDARETRKKAPEMKHHPIKEKTIPAASGLTGSRSAPRGRHSSTAPGTAPGTTTSSRAKKTSNIQEKTTTGAAKRRTETAVQI